jgi:hypothetical protein
MRRVHLHLVLLALIVVLASLAGQFLWGDGIVWDTQSGDGILWGTLGITRDAIVWGS